MMYVTRENDERWSWIEKIIKNKKTKPVSRVKKERKQSAINNNKKGNYREG
jgi:hypothetical protein